MRIGALPFSALGNEEAYAVWRLRQQVKRLRRRSVTRSGPWIRQRAKPVAKIELPAHEPDRVVGEREAERDGKS